MPRKTKKAMKTVQSGIEISGYSKSDATPQPKETFITSRTARVLLAGTGFLADAYDLFVINLVLRLLRDEYPSYAESGKLHVLEGSVASAALIGSILGQLVAGSLADVIGRKKIFVATAALITIGSFGSACSVDTPLLNVYGQISCWRFFLGAGVGGEYPLAATVTSESTSAGRRGSLMAAVFAMQGVGSLMSVLVVIICLSLHCSSTFTWRFALAFGATPAIIAFPWRLRMHETESFERVKKDRKDAIANLKESLHLSHVSTSEKRRKKYNSIVKSDEEENGSKPLNHNGEDSKLSNVKAINTPNVSTALLSGSKGNANANASTGSSLIASNVPGEITVNSISRLTELSNAFKFYKYHLLGTALSWFLLDVDFYANGLFNHEVTSVILSSKGEKTSQMQDAINSAILCCISIPGYYLSVMYIEKVGRKNIQLMGFFVMSLLFLICGIGYDWLLDESSLHSNKKYLFLTVYALTFLFSNFGPNTTTFVIPGEIYPAEVRATCHGFSAASGKLGAATGAYFFPLLLGPGGANRPTKEGLKASMYVCSAVALAGVFVTFFFIPRYSAEGLEDEDNYLNLEHTCLNPTDEDLLKLEHYRKVKNSGGYEMVQIVESSADYAMNEFYEEGDDL